MAPKRQHRNGDHIVETTAFVYEQVGQVSKYTTVHMKLIIVRGFLLCGRDGRGMSSITKSFILGTCSSW